MIYNNRFPQYDAIKKNDTEQTFTQQWPHIVDVISGLIYLGFVTDNLEGFCKLNFME